MRIFLLTVPVQPIMALSLELHLNYVPSTHLIQSPFYLITVDAMRLIPDRNVLRRG